MTNEPQNKSVFITGLDALKSEYRKMIWRAWISDLADLSKERNVEFENANTEIVLLLHYIEDPLALKWMQNAKICSNPEYRNRLLNYFFDKHMESKFCIERLITNTKNCQAVVIN